MKPFEQENYYARRWDPPLSPRPVKRFSVVIISIDSTCCSTAGSMNHFHESNGQGQSYIVMLGCLTFFGASLPGSEINSNNNQERRPLATDSRVDRQTPRCQVFYQVGYSLGIQQNRIRRDTNLNILPSYSRSTQLFR